MIGNEFHSWPHVLDEDELPFVLGFTTDSRPAKSIQGVQFRRGVQRYRVDVPFSDLWLRACGVFTDDGNCYLLAYSGPILNDWWPLLQRGGYDPTRPCLSAGVSNGSVTMRNPHTDNPVGINILGPSDWVPGVSAIVGIGSDLSDETLLLGDIVMLGVIKVALLVLCEYRTLVHEVPHANVESDGMKVELATMLEAAQAVTDMIDWQIVK